MFMKWFIWELVTECYPDAHNKKHKGITLFHEEEINRMKINGATLYLQSRNAETIVTDTILESRIANILLIITCPLVSIV